MSLSSSDADVTLRTLDTSVVSVGADATAGVDKFEGAEDPETLVDLSLAICAIPAAVTAAAEIAPRI